MFTEKRDDNREQKSADDANGECLVNAAVCLVVIVCADEVRHENLVSAAETDSENDGECGEVPGEDAGGHCRGAHIDHHRGDEHLEKLETDGFGGGGEADAHPVGEEYAGAFPVANFAVVVYFELEYEPENDRRNEPRECGGEGHAVNAHLGESKISFEEYDVQGCVRCDGERIADEIPDGKAVGCDKGCEDGLQCAKGEPERDYAQKLHGVFCGFIGESHPAGNLPRKRINDERECHSEQYAPEEDHGLRAVGMAVLLCADVLRDDARAGLRESVKCGKKRTENREHGADARGCGFGSARKEPTVHHGLDHAHGEREDERPREADERTVFDLHLLHLSKN